MARRIPAWILIPLALTACSTDSFDPRRSGSPGAAGDDGESGVAGSDTAFGNMAASSVESGQNQPVATTGPTGTGGAATAPGGSGPTSGPSATGGITLVFDETGGVTGTATTTGTGSTTGIGTTTGTGAATGTGTTGGTATPVMFVGPGGYVTADSWEGYAFTATEDPSVGSTIAPADYSALQQGSELCAAGVVAASPDWEGYAALGINLNQPVEGGEGSVGVWHPEGAAGVEYALTNHAESVVRFQIQGAAGYPDEAWCAPSPGDLGQIPWTDFNTHCWDNSGEFYDGSVPLQTLLILVPGDDVEETPFDFCIKSVLPY